MALEQALGFSRHGWDRWTCLHRAFTRRLPFMAGKTCLRAAARQEVWGRSRLFWQLPSAVYTFHHLPRLPPTPLPLLKLWWQAPHAASSLNCADCPSYLLTMAFPPTYYTFFGVSPHTLAATNFPFTAIPLEGFSFLAALLCVCFHLLPPAGQAATPRPPHTACNIPHAAET